MTPILVSNSLGEFDLSFLRQEDADLANAIIISLFVDKRVSQDELPEGQTDLRGWFGDGIDGSTEEMGSKLWLLSREKKTDTVRKKTEDYSKEALAWMTREGLARKVSVTAELQAVSNLNIIVEITKPSGDQVSFKFNYLWGGSYGV